MYYSIVYMVWSVFRYVEPFRCDSQVWQTDRRTDGWIQFLITNAALHNVA